jgi:transposase
MDLAELEAFGKTIKDKRTYRRYLCIWLKEAQGKTAKVIAAQVGYHQRHVQRIQQSFQLEGITRVFPQYKGGNSRLISVKEELEVLSTVEGSITVQPIIEAVSKAVGRDVVESTVYAMLKRHGWKAKKPRPRHPKASTEAQQVFKKPI